MTTREQIERIRRKHREREDWSDFSAQSYCIECQQPTDARGRCETAVVCDALLAVMDLHGWDAETWPCPTIQAIEQHISGEARTGEGRG